MSVFAAIALHDLRKKTTLKALSKGFKNSNDYSQNQRHLFRAEETPLRCCASGLRDEHVQARGHREASVLDLELLVAAVLVRELAHELKRVVHAERLGRTDVTSRSKV